MRIVFILLIATAVSWAQPGLAQEEQVLQHKLLAPCCYRETLDRHASGEAAKMRQEIHRLVEHGESERQIIDLYKVRYGARILAEPEGAALWIGTGVPFLFLALATAGVIWLIGRWRREALAKSALLVLMTAVSFASSGCSHKNTESAAPPKRYEMHGQIVRLDPKLQIAVIDAAKIDGWMEAMTMEYPVQDKGEFARLKPGDRIQATVFVRDLDYWIGNIHPAASRPGGEAMTQGRGPPCFLSVRPDPR